MSLSFELIDFLLLLREYNRDIWPLQVAALALGLLTVFLAVSKKRYSGSIICAILAFFWLWTGAVFNLLYFRGFYPPALGFVPIFIAQGLIFAFAAFGRPGVSFHFKATPRSYAAAAMALYALIGYPALEGLWGRGYPESLPFGLVPCPTTLFTLAVLLLAEAKIPPRLWALPVAYALAGIVPFLNGIREDIGLIIGGVLALYFFLRKPSGKSAECGF
ncbi:MAG: hypothetical protein JW843_07935 [Candidatus Aminicenantes bacterium]|nr:hypothetical protein [Candidatus Aminicenantes bacterium]